MAHYGSSYDEHSGIASPSRRSDGASRRPGKAHGDRRREDDVRGRETAKPLVLIIDRDAAAWERVWASFSDLYDLRAASDRVAAMAFVHEHRPAVVFMELAISSQANDPNEGIVTLREILEVERFTKVVVISGGGDRAIALKAIGAGAYDLISKPLVVDELRQLLARSFHVAHLEREFRELKQQMEPAGFAGMIGAGPAMQAVFASIRKVAASEAPVTILGESGTGKEMVARAIHEQSARRDGPFVAINCSAIPESLLESELFGHEKGAFTGASAQRKGRIESASKGTLFLDEIGEVPLSVQVKLLRFLQEQTIERVGGRVEMKVDARILAATNADLEKAMREGTFREDFFYRLAVVRITLPSLRDRGEDITLIARSFLHRYAVQNRRQNLVFSSDALRAIERHPWPGNIRELQNRVRRAVIMAEGSRVTPHDLELESTEPVPGPSLKEAREDLEREMVHGALRRHGGKISPAALELGISRPTLYDLMDKYAVQKTSEQSA
ncbi:MAG: PEP-CTERM-box response regulator transcription factor [Opitutaceae bacterium]|nr:PEP-CTERM-box response regulator transcription factor [Opitutaceae bacterium]